MSKKKNIAYYITAHGYGHGVRSGDIIAALTRLYPDLSITVVSDLPLSFLKTRMDPDRNSFRRGRFDAGMVQLDSIRVDVPATLKKAADLCAQKPHLLAREKRFLKNARIDLVVSDIAALPLEAASEAGLPALAVGNFSWDWIYEPFALSDARWEPIIREFKEGYAKADLLLKLPFAGEMKAFRRAVDIPILSRPGRPSKKKIAAITGARLNKPWALLSFTTLDWDPAALDRVESLEGFEFFTVLPLAWRRRNIHALDRRDVAFSNALASVDMAITKPGYGILSECIVNRKPILYADRSDFREYDVLVAAIRKYCRQLHIPTDKLYRGELEDALLALPEQPAPPCRMSAGGSRVAARIIAGFL